MTTQNDWNRGVIEEFRNNGGKVGGGFEGAPTSPDWYHNLVANPEVSIEVGTDTIPVTATFAQGDERDQLYSRQAALYPQFAEYERSTTRRIPVVTLTRG